MQRSLQALDKLGAIAAYDPAVATAYSDISQEIRNWVRHDPGLIERLMDADQRPAAYVCYIAVNELVKRRLICGEHHIAPGKLDSYGQSLLAIYKIVASERERLGFSDSASLQAEAEKLEKLISQGSPQQGTALSRPEQPCRRDHHRPSANAAR